MSTTYILPPQEALERAISDYLNISRNKHNRNLFREMYNYWPAEEMAWNKLQEAIERVKKENSKCILFKTTADPHTV